MERNYLFSSGWSRGAAICLMLFVGFFACMSALATRDGYTFMIVFFGSAFAMIIIAVLWRIGDIAQNTQEILEEIKGGRY